MRGSLIAGGSRPNAAARAGGFLIVDSWPRRVRTGLGSCSASDPTANSGRRAGGCCANRTTVTSVRRPTGSPVSGNAASSGLSRKLAASEAGARLKFPFGPRRDRTGRPSSAGGGRTFRPPASVIGRDFAFWSRRRCGCHCFAGYHPYPAALNADPRIPLGQRERSLGRRTGGFSARPRANIARSASAWRSG